ncbi:GNAT family N-acetyltransferase [Flavobacterium sp.]|uniref:GNAT family N-acetyltransferase n=1 Tax=Flavobacterium sp. TaxID=239 RepID=UPI002600CBEA|nr:GNAT family N-acetyltransferase [Flavobacterium sp.]
MKNNHSIQEITAIRTYPVRQAVLRAGKPIESCHFVGDELPSTHHFGYFTANQLLGVISLFEAKNATFEQQKSFQIRGMAVLESHQKKGIGEALVREVETFCKKQKTTLIWFNARTSAVGFYKKMDYEIAGSEFEIKEVGPHFLMYKKI